ncbi:MAG: T9SS type A sorting domain-containing protein [Actinomycetota bacterium]|nr:T9SS type A sorting domain-containing protein [Actinomycetota bacterium]
MNASGQSVGGNVPHTNSMQLFQNFPNPFNPVASAFTTISYNIPNLTKKSSVGIFNIKGQLVNELTIAPESNSVVWYGKDKKGNYVHNGIYLYRISTENKTISKKMILMR